MLLIVSIGTQEEDSSQEENCKPCAIISDFFQQFVMDLTSSFSIYSGTQEEGHHQDQEDSQEARRQEDNQEAGC